MTGDAEAEGGAAHGDIKNSTVLLGDLEEVRQKVEKYRERASLTDHLSVKVAREAVASCYQYVPPPPEPESLSYHPYRANPTTTLNCWSEVAAFRSSVAELEQVCEHFSSNSPSLQILTRCPV
jgi:altered-inheritance-of-mitochondria protein 13